MCTGWTEGDKGWTGRSAPLLLTLVPPDNGFYSSVSARITEVRCSVNTLTHISPSCWSSTMKTAFTLLTEGTILGEIDGILSPSCKDDNR